MSFRLVMRYGGQVLLAVGPFLTLQWSLLDLYGLTTPDKAGLVSLGYLSGTKEQVELKAALYVTVVGFLLTIFSEGLENYPASRRIESFRSDYLNEQRKDWLTKLGQQVRVNVMYAKRPWYVLFALRRLEWAWSDGYRPPAHLDSHMGFWSWQGVCGRAFRKERAVFADLRSAPRPALWKCWCTEFNLWPWQLRRTVDVKAVLSVPIFISRGQDAQRWECVGVINVDATEDAGAELLERNAEALIDYFYELGLRVAKLH